MDADLVKRIRVARNRLAFTETKNWQCKWMYDVRVPESDARARLFVPAVRVCVCVCALYSFAFPSWARLEERRLVSISHEWFWTTVEQSENGGHDDKRVIIRYVNDGRTDGNGLVETSDLPLYVA